jgi:hypothetical protein
VSPPFDGLERRRENRAVARRKPLSVAQGQAQAFKLFQQLANDWKPLRVARELPGAVDERGSAGATVASDGDAVWNVLTILLDALSGQSGWEPLRRLHDGLINPQSAVWALRRPIPGDNR